MNKNKQYSSSANMNKTYLSRCTIRKLIGIAFKVSQYNMKCTVETRDSGKNVGLCRRTFPVARSAFSWWVTIYVGELSAGG